MEQVDRFVANPSKQAYEAFVDECLDSNAYGERWAQPWLDLARYADSNGFQADQLRESWAYRDWVINAMNNDLPINQFVIEQLAGDLLPEPEKPFPAIPSRSANYALPLLSDMTRGVFCKLFNK